MYACVSVCVCVTSALCPGCSSLESSRTLTDVRPWGVHTFSMCTRVSLAFIIVWRTKKLINLVHLHVPHSALQSRSSLCQKLTDALSSSIQPEAHVALTAITDARHGDTPAIQAEVAVGLAHVGDILGLDNNGT